MDVLPIYCDFSMSVGAKEQIGLLFCIKNIKKSQNIKKKDSSCSCQQSHGIIT